MRNILILLTIALGFAACETSTEGRVEGEPIQFAGSFLLEGENMLSAENPNPLFDYADHMNIERTQIEELTPTDVVAEITDNTVDSLLLGELHLMITANEQDTLQIASLDTIHANVKKHTMNVEGGSDVLPYLKGENPTWLLKVVLKEDYEETLPFRITMGYDVKYIEK